MSGSLQQRVRNQFLTAAAEAFPQVDRSIFQSAIEVTQSTQAHFGHYQCNAAMKLAKIVGANPRAIATTLVDAVGRSESKMIGKLEIAGPGFINITLDSQFLSNEVQLLLTSPNLGITPTHKPQRIVVDFSSPNVAKEMHVGHLRSTIIGDALARLFEFQGENVLRLNHIGDWGTAFGMLIAYMKEVVPGVLKGESETDSTHLVEWYKASKKRFDDDADFKKQSQLEVVKLQGGDPEALKAWKIICTVSEKDYQQIYDLLGIRLNTRGESFYNPLLPEVVKDLEAKGLVTVSDGAKCIFLEGFSNREGEPLPLMIQKSDGGYNYDTTDMAALRHRVAVEHADRIVIVTDSGQQTHFMMVFAAAQMAGYYDPKKVRCDHVPFGLVLGSDGKKFKTRSGDTEKLIDLITAGIALARKIIDEREMSLSDPEKEQLARVLGIGAIKYADLSCNRIGDYHFSYERMLRFEGNTAAFLMYSYVRALSILRKTNSDKEALLKAGAKPVVAHPTEVALSLQLLQFHETLDAMAEELLPHRLTDYLFNLAQQFNAFHRDCRVEGSDEQASRLLLCAATADVLHTGLNILGLETVERM